MWELCSRSKESGTYLYNLLVDIRDQKFYDLVFFKVIFPYFHQLKNSSFLYTRYSNAVYIYAPNPYARKHCYHIDLPYWVFYFNQEKIIDRLIKSSPSKLHEPTLSDDLHLTYLPFLPYLPFTYPLPIHIAAQCGHAQTVEKLIAASAGHFIDAHSSFYNHTPAQLAVAFGHLECLKLLVEKDNTLLTSPMRKERNELLFLIASSHGHADILNYLLDLEKDAPDVNSGYGGNTALHFACKYGHTNAVKLLLEKKADAAKTNKKGYLPIHLAASQGYVNVVTFLMEKKVATISKTTSIPSEPLTPLLYYAVRGGHLPCVKQILSLDKKPAVKTALMIAVRKNHHEIINFLQTELSKINPQEVTQTLKKALCCAKNNQDIETIRVIKKQILSNLTKKDLEENPEFSALWQKAKDNISDWQNTLKSSQTELLYYMYQREQEPEYIRTLSGIFKGKYGYSKTRKLAAATALINVYILGEDKSQLKGHFLPRHNSRLGRIYKKLTKECHKQSAAEVAGLSC